MYEGPGSYVPLARIDGGREKATIRWYHCGVNGAPDRVTNEEGKTEWRHDTGGWGRTESEYEYGMIRENLRYQGQYLDRETGLHYNLHRYFAPECGRFIQPDPIGLLGGINLYQYAPNPLGWIDPLGLKSCFSSSTGQKRAEDIIKKHGGIQTAENRYQMPNGATNASGTAGWRDDILGHPEFGAGSHVNAWNEAEGILSNLHLDY